jgi:thymidylate kinase
LSLDAAGTSVFGGVLDALERQSLQYRLLRPGVATGVEDELDLLVWPGERTRFRELAASHGFKRLRLRSPGKEVFGRLTDGGILYLDVHYAFVQRGIVYRPLHPVLRRAARTPAGHQMLTDEDLLIHLFFHNLLGKKGLQDKDLPRVQALLAGPLDHDYLDQQMSDAESRRLFREFCDVPDAFAQGTARAAAAGAQLEHRLGGASSVRAMWRGLRRRFLPGGRRGVHVAFIGVDGCGKSTTTKLATEGLTALKLRPDLVYMGPWGQVRSRVLRRALRLGCAPPKEEAASLRQRIAGRIKGTAYYFAVYIELWQRFLVDVRPALARGHVVLSDRYVYDLRYLYKRRRVDGFPWLRGAVCALFPQPDLIVFLHNDPQTIASRKDQLSPAEIDEFQQLYRQALAPYPVLAIKTDVGADDVAARIVRRATEIYFERNSAP